MMSLNDGRSSSTSCCCLEWRRRQYNSLHIVAKKLSRLCKAGQMFKRAASLHELSCGFFFGGGGGWWGGGGWTEVDPSNSRVKLKGDCKHMLHRSALRKKGSLDLIISVSCLSSHAWDKLSPSQHPLSAQAEAVRAVAATAAGKVRWQQQLKQQLKVHLSCPSLLSLHTDPKEYIVDRPVVSAGRSISSCASVITDLVQLLARGSTMPTACSISARLAGHPQNLMLLWNLL